MRCLFRQCGPRTARFKECPTTTYEQQEQETENAFNRRIEKLCQELWSLPTFISYHLSASQVATRLRTSKFFRSFISAPRIPLIQHLKGSGFNHTTNITLPSSYDESHRNLILLDFVRLARFFHAHIHFLMHTAVGLMHNSCLNVCLFFVGHSDQSVPVAYKGKVLPHR